jgi:hypothetical protein
MQGRGEEPRLQNTLSPACPLPSLGVPGGFSPHAALLHSVPELNSACACSLVPKVQAKVYELLLAVGHFRLPFLKQLRGFVELSRKRLCRGSV